MSLSKAERTAKRIAYSYPQGYQYNPILVVNDVLLSNNIKVIPFDFNSKLSGMLVLYQNDYYISVNSNHSRRRRTFTISHELGHYFLHSNTQTAFTCNEVLQCNNCGIEREANDFAAELLMPTKTFYYYLKKGYSLSEISNCLRVSYEAVKWRFVNFCERNIKGFTPEKKRKLIKKLFS